MTDNPALHRAFQIAQTRGAQVLALACLEPRRWADQQFGLSRVGSHWMRFRAESLRALRQELEALDGGLWLSSEEPVYAVNRIQQQYSVITLVCDEPVATEERLEVARLEAEGYQTVSVFVDDLFRFEQLPFDLDELPATFSKFRKVVEKKPSLLPDRPIDSPTVGGCIAQGWADPAEWQEALEIPLDPNTEVPTHGGGESANRHWQAYLDAGALSHYKQTRNAFQGPMQSSHLSAWLAHGCIPPDLSW